MTELTIDKCVLVHCDSTAGDASKYRSSSLAFLGHWQAETSLVACVNGGIRKEYNSFSPAGAAWWRSVVGQSRYCDKKRQIDKARRADFCRKKNVPLHGEDFDYVDAASQSTSLLWLSNEANWQNAQYRQRIHAEFQVGIQNVNEYMNGVAGQATAEAL
jgi:hypothetical protein